MNLAELKESFYDYVDDHSKDRFDEDQVRRFLNTGLRVVAREIDLQDESYFEKCKLFSVIGSEIDQLFPLPADFVRAKHAERLNGNDEPTRCYWVEFKDRHDEVAWPPHRLRDNLRPFVFLKGKEFGVVTPKEDYTVRLWYAYSPATLDDANDEPLEIPRTHHDTIALQAAQIAYGIEEKAFPMEALLQKGMRDLLRVTHGRNRAQTRHVRVIDYD